MTDAATGTSSNAGWHPDPMGRHELRYFDGSSWTEHVADGGVTSTDPLQASAGSAQYYLYAVGGSVTPFMPGRMELIERIAPMVADRFKATQGVNWGWIAQRIAPLAPEDHILHAQDCYHGEGNRGSLVATTEQLWWLGNGMFRKEDVPIGYEWQVETVKYGNVMGTAAALMSGSGLGTATRNGILIIGGEQFQMKTDECDYFAQLIRQYQRMIMNMPEA